MKTMMNGAKLRRIGIASVVLLLTQFFFPAAAKACPLCQDELNEPTALAFSVTALLMLSMPFILVGLIGLQLMSALNPHGYQRVYNRMVSVVKPRWLYVLASLLAVSLFIYAFSPAAPAQTRMLPRTQLIGHINLNGKPIAVAQLDNKVVVVNFFASWCEPCKAEVADLGELYREFRDSTPGLEVIGIAFDFEHQDEPAVQPHVHPDGIVHYHALPNTLQTLLAFLQTSRAAYAVLPYAPEIAESFGEIRAIPATFVFDRQGTLSKKYVGPPSLATLMADVQKLLAQ